MISKRNSQKDLSLSGPCGTIKLSYLTDRELASKDDDGIGMNVVQQSTWQPAWVAVVTHAGSAFSMVIGSMIAMIIWRLRLPTPYIF